MSEKPKRRWLRWLIVLVLLVPGGIALAEVLRVYAGLNDHTVVPGKVYRSSQPTEKQIRQLAAKHRIRTVLNLRGQAAWDGWYQGECAGTAGAGINQEDITLSAGALPFPSELRRAVEVLDRTEYPILIHCKQGADRTGLLSAMVLLLYTDATLAEARKQLLPNYGHWRVTRTAAMDEFFDLYEDWLKSENTEHSRDRFRRWVLDVYTRQTPKSELKFLEAVPVLVKAKTPFGVKVRSTNLSTTPWTTSAGTFAGIHISYCVFDSKMNQAHSGRAGLKNGVVNTGEHLDTTVLIKGLTPGRYTLAVETHDATEASIPFRTQSFVKYGDESLLAEFVVYE